MIIRLRKRQLTYQQRKEIIQALLYYGLSYIQSVVRHFQCSVSTIWRIWSLYQNGGKNDESLMLKARHSLHPKEHTQYEHDLIVKALAEFPNVRFTKLYTVLVQRGYNRSYYGLWRYIAKHNLIERQKAVCICHINKPYKTPVMLGFKWQMDIKFVESRFMTDGKKYYQYTMIDEATRKAFERAYPDKSTYTTKQFVIHAIRYFGYKPLQIQTDNGLEFTNRLIAKHERSKINYVDDFLNKQQIEHKLIRPATPRHDGKVERRHREDEWNYQGKQFDSLAILNKYLVEWCKDKDDTFTFALCKRCRKSPNMKQSELLYKLKRFARQKLNLNRKVQLQELIYAYVEYERIKQERTAKPSSHILKIPLGIEQPTDIQAALNRL